uniref:GBF-interacting protein 1 N-terminal domain-containing protein n=2 Tax=Zea mays TaxID=4577 RepID=A0A804N9G0_MAIZE
MVQSLKGILADRSEGEIYATLCDCGMDPDIAVERLISQTPAQLRWSLTKQEWLLATGLTGLLNPYGLWSPRHSQSDVSSSEMEFGTARQYDTTDLDEALQRESFEALNPRAVAVVIDPIQKRTIDFRFWLLNPYGLWSPRHSQSDVSSSEMEFGTARQYDTTDLDEALQRE